MIPGGHQGGQLDFHVWAFYAFFEEKNRLCYTVSIICCLGFF